jgi:N-acetylglucosaminyl-diphospho-decaprenol L-rhamnosyltransferase
VAEELAVPLVVVDNDSRDGGLDLLRRTAARRPALRLVEMGRNAGYAAAVNAAFAAVPGRDLLLLNPDVGLDGSQPVVEMVRAMREFPRVAVAAPRLVGEGDEVQASARRYPSLAALLGSLPRLGGLAPLRRARERYEQPSRGDGDAVVDWVVGAAMMIRRSAYEEVGGWDERYFLYCEDVDFCRRCALAGWEVAYLPRIRLRHRFRRESEAGRRGARAVAARRRHYASHARLFARAPRLLVGGGRGTDRPPAGVEASR